LRDEGTLYHHRLPPDELAFLSRPGQDRIQLDLFDDYRANVASYPRWQEYLRSYRPPTLVLWGTYDPSFTVAGATAYGRDVPDAEIHLLEAGHFALDEAATRSRRASMRFCRDTVSASGADEAVYTFTVLALAWRLRSRSQLGWPSTLREHRSQSRHQAG